MTPELYDNDGLRRRACAWVRANGLDPANTPVDCSPSITDGRLTIRQWIRRNGGLIISQTDPNTVLSEMVTVALRVEPEGDVATWVAGQTS